jgi:hypothetical protein
MGATCVVVSVALMQIGFEAVGVPMAPAGQLNAVDTIAPTVSVPATLVVHVGSPAVGEPDEPAGQLDVDVVVAATVEVAITGVTHVGSPAVGEPEAPGGQLCVVSGAAPGDYDVLVVSGEPGATSSPGQM